MQRTILFFFLSFFFGAVSLAEESRPTPQNEEELRERLKERISFELAESNTFEEMFAILHEKAGIRAAIDEKGAGSLGATVIRMSKVFHDLPIRTALRQILRDQDLTYYIDDTLLVITSVDEAKNNRKTRIYVVGDLLKRLADDGQIHTPHGMHSPTNVAAPFTRNLRRG